MKFGLIFLMAMLPLLASAAENQEYVILLHGLCRTSRSMVPMERALSKAGYHVLNVDYPSRTASIEKLSEDAIGRAVADCSESRRDENSFCHALARRHFGPQLFVAACDSAAWPRGDARPAEPRQRSGGQTGFVVDFQKTQRPGGQ